jgi:tight adherence protein B
LTAGLLGLLAWGACCLFFVAGALALWTLLDDPTSFPHRNHRRYVGHLDRGLRVLLLPARGHWWCLGQLFALEASALLSIWLGNAWLLAAVPVVVFGPTAWLERRRARRLVRLEHQIDGFMLTLANALRATPSLGNALGQTQRLLQEPLRQELGLSLQELRVGSSVEQAMLDLGTRVQSAVLDSALLSLLIGRQVGGDLPKVLETTAATLREMERLRGVLKSKTAEAKAQMWVLALIPALIIFAFNAINPGYFEPLLGSFSGWLITTAAGVLWLTSLLLARRVLAVKL